MIYRYSCQHSHFWYLYKSFHLFIFDVQNVLLPSYLLPRSPEISLFQAFTFLLGNAYKSSFRWIFWAPLHLRCNAARLVSYYAFFKGLESECKSYLLALLLRNRAWQLPVTRLLMSIKEFIFVYLNDILCAIILSSCNSLHLLFSSLLCGLSHYKEDSQG